MLIGVLVIPIMPALNVGATACFGVQLQGVLQPSYVSARLKRLIEEEAIYGVLLLAAFVLHVVRAYIVAP